MNALEDLAAALYLLGNVLTEEQKMQLWKRILADEMKPCSDRWAERLKVVILDKSDTREYTRAFNDIYQHIHLFGNIFGTTASPDARRCESCYQVFVKAMNLVVNPSSRAAKASGGAAT